MGLSTEDFPTVTESAPIIGETTWHTLDSVKSIREQQIVFRLAKVALEKYFRDKDDQVKAWLFPDLVEITRRWLAECVTCKDNVFPQLLLFVEKAHAAAEHIYRGIVASTAGEKTLMPILESYDAVGSTRYVDFETTRPTYKTDPAYCHISHVVADTESWEQKMAEAIEELGREGLVRAYAKNHNLSFFIPYTTGGEDRRYIPDFILRVDDGHGKDDLLNLIVEVSGMPKKDKAAKVATARTLWVPAVNNHGGFGRWAFIEIADPWDAKDHLARWESRRHLNSGEV
jgi:type III restriction enzyme